MELLITVKTKGDLYSLRKAAADQLVYCTKDNAIYHLKDRSRYNKSDGWEIVTAAATRISIPGGGSGGAIDDTLYVKYQAQYIGDPSLAPDQNIYGNINLYGGLRATSDVVAYAAGVGGGSFWDDMPPATATTIGGIQLTGNVPPELFLREDGTWQLVTSGTMVHSALSNLDYATSGHTGFAPTSHNHAWADITSGVPTSFTPTAHQLDSATYHTVSGLTGGHFLKAINATSFGFSALSSTEVLPTLSDWFTLEGTAPNQYIRCKFPFAGDYDIQAFTDSGWLPGDIWESMPLATSTSIGGIQLTGDAPPEKFLREDGTWQIVTSGTFDHAGLSNLGYAASGHTGFEASLGNPLVSGYVLSSTTLGVRSWIEIVTPIDDIFDWSTNKYTPYAAKSAGKFDIGAVNPSNSPRLNYDGYFYSTMLYSNGLFSLGNNLSLVGTTSMYLQSPLIMTTMQDTTISGGSRSGDRGFHLTVKGGDASGMPGGDYNGGDVYIYGGSKANSGVAGATYIENIKFKDYIIDAQDGSLKHLTIKSGHASGVAGTDGGHLYLKAGNAILADSGSLQGYIYLVPGNGYSSGQVPGVYLGDSNTISTLRLISCEGTETNIGISIYPKGTGLLYIGNNNQMLITNTTINLGADLRFGNVGANNSIIGAYGTSLNPNGWNLTVSAGVGYNPGNNNGGHLYLTGGANNGSGTYGNVIIAQNGGKVGIGLAVPSEALEVSGNILLGISTGKIGFTDDITNFYLGYRDSTDGVVGHSYYGWTFEQDGGYGLNIAQNSEPFFNINSPKVLTLNSYATGGGYISFQHSTSNVGYIGSRYHLTGSTSGYDSDFTIRSGGKISIHAGGAERAIFDGATFKNTGDIIAYATI